MDLDIKIASFEEGSELQKVVFEALRTIDFRIEYIVDKADFPKILRDVISAMALSYLFEPSVQKPLWACLGRCLYNGKRITKETFDAAETRKDFVPIAIKCVAVNTEPFTEGLLSAWKLVAPVQAENSPK